MERARMRYKTKWILKSMDTNSFMRHKINRKVETYKAPIKIRMEQETHQTTYVFKYTVTGSKIAPLEGYALHRIIKRLEDHL